MPHTWPRNVTSTARWKSAGLTSQAGANTVVMASLTHTSIGPSSSSTRVAAASTWSNWLTSVGQDQGPAAGRLTSAAAASRPASPRASRATSKPCSAKARAVARPTPADAPVITATLPCWHDVFLSAFAVFPEVAGRGRLRARKPAGGEVAGQRLRQWSRLPASLPLPAGSPGGSWRALAAPAAASDAASSASANAAVRHRGESAPTAIMLAE